MQDQLSEIRTAVGQIQGAIGELRGEVRGYAATHVRHEAELQKLDARQRKTESLQSRMVGYAVGAGAVAAFLIDVALRIVG